MLPQIGMCRMTLKEFIEQYRLEHGDMTLREFARQVGVSPATINRWLDQEKPEKPDMLSLVKLSKATGQDLLTLVEIAYPEEVRSVPLDPSAKVLAGMIMRLPNIIRESVIKLIEAYVRQQGRQ